MNRAHTGRADRRVPRLDEEVFASGVLGSAFRAPWRDCQRWTCGRCLLESRIGVEHEGMAYLLGARAASVEVGSVGAGPLYPLCRRPYKCLCRLRTAPFDR